MPARTPPIPSSTPIDSSSEHDQNLQTTRPDRVARNASSFHASPTVTQNHKHVLERAWRLVNDPYIDGVSSRRVKCGGCGEYYALDRRREWYPSLWVKHKKLCEPLHQKFEVDPNHASVTNMPVPSQEVIEDLQRQRSHDEWVQRLLELVAGKLLDKSLWQARIGGGRDMATDLSHPQASSEPPPSSSSILTSSTRDLIHQTSFPANMTPETSSELQVRRDGIAPHSPRDDCFVLPYSGVSGDRRTRLEVLADICVDAMEESS
ncbi:hypothetical protein K435DRAFT_859977 [Dendrothele bispora CBS 962.96]|uniref:Uncharacterized protein n=1 Tax=Dendrothele bispora (strain CBS 962.96) TaxID=1314807 RepID=A0A4S8LZM1_DENBC|nr:hypothetical protein K435DRAFT_859977 [Dendrothele bispora CBS 962.96]